MYNVDEEKNGYEKSIYGTFLSVAYLVYRGKVYKKSRQSKKLLKEIDDLDAVWDEDHIYTRVEEIFYAVQNAWTMKSLEDLQPYLSDRLMENWKAKIDWMDIRKERNVLENIQLLSRSLVGIYDALDDSKDMAWFYIESFIEFWKLIRKEDEFYLDEVRQKDEMNIQDFVNFSEEIGNENNGNRMRHPS